jgi:4-hydroxybenzoate polyprenyltransferase
VGAIVMRGAGCTINDMWDRDFDKHVERTKNRPLASGQVSMPEAFGFLGLQLSCGLGVLLSLDQSCIALGLASMPLVVAYPLMKRLTNWPQLVLGLTFNWGALVGWSAVHGTLANGLPAPVLPLYAAGVCWTLVYDTLYGYQDRQDDRKLGLKSTSLHLGDEPQWALSAIAGGMLGGLTLSGLAVGLSPVYYCGVAAVGSQLMWQIWTADTSGKSPGNLWARFDSNKYVGAVLTASIVAGHF